MGIDHKRLIAALRDTAKKAVETTVVEVPDYSAMLGHTGIRRQNDHVQTEEREAYSKQWISGRLMGMADTIEALVEGGAK